LGETLGNEGASPQGRVMIFVHDLRASGVVRNTLAIAAKIAERHDVTLVARSDDGFLADQARADPRWRLVTLYGDGRRGSQLGAILRLRRLIRHETPDVLLSTGNRGHWVVRPATIGMSRPLRLYRISNSIDRSGRGRAGLRGLGARLLAADADTLLLVGRTTADAPQFAAAVAKGRAEILTNGVDRERARKLAQAPSPCAWLAGDMPVILSVGRLAPQKDFPTLVRAVAKASRVHPLKLAIVGKGDPDAAASLRALATAEGLDERFLLPGETDNVFAWLARATAFVLPSRWEGSSMALLEALALDVPIVATREAGDAAHILDDGRYGVIVQAGDSDGMAQAILRQISEATVRAGDRADVFNLEATIARYAQLVDRAVTRAGAEMDR